MINLDEVEHAYCKILCDEIFGRQNFLGDFIRHTIVGGASYKDFDFGAGLLYISDGYSSGIGLSITLGYNIRCYKHR